MTTVVVKIKKEEVSYFKEALATRKNVEFQKTTNPYEVFRATYKNNLIIGYSSGSIVLNSEDLRPLVLDILIEVRKKNLDFDLVIGSDEAGKGEWLGPLTVASVALIPEQVLVLQSKGIRDSKLLKIDQILELSDFIKRNSVAWYVVVISPKRFNELIREVKDEGKSLNDLLAWGHATAIDRVLTRLTHIPKKTRIIIDEFDRIKTDKRIQRILDLTKFDYIQKHRAEDEIAVASSSILARAEREKHIDSESQRLGIDLRNLDPISLLSKPFAEEVAKLSYLKPKNPR